MTTKVKELTPMQVESLKFMADPKNMRPPHISDLAKNLGHVGRASAWNHVTALVQLNYLTPDLKPTKKAKQLLGGKND